jgi:hypothetical protein
VIGRLGERKMGEEEDGGRGKVFVFANFSKSDFDKCCVSQVELRM